MLVTSFRSRTLSKLSSSKLHILPGSVLCMQKSQDTSFCPGNLLIASISFTGPAASTGKNFLCRSDNLKTTVMVCMLLLCYYTKTLDMGGPDLPVPVTASICCAYIISLLIK